LASALASSCAINAAQAEGAPPFDIDDDIRPVGALPDIGCDEYVP